jgi:hypothetical protein
MSIFFTAVIADRPNIAGAMTILVAFGRLLDGMGYARDIKARFPPFLMAQFVAAIGVGYGALMGMSAVGVGWAPLL